MLQPSQFTLRIRLPILLNNPQCQIKRPQFELARWTYSTSAAPKPMPKPSDDGDEDVDHRPKPLNRPIGQNRPPLVGENSGKDPRSWRERRDDFVNYDKHLERRAQLCVTSTTPWQNLVAKDYKYQRSCETLLPRMEQYALSQGQIISVQRKTLSSRQGTLLP